MWMLVLFTSYGPAIVESWPTLKGCEEAGKYTGLKYECLPQENRPAPRSF